MKRGLKNRALSVLLVLSLLLGLAPAVYTSGGRGENRHFLRRLPQTA